MTQIEFAEGMIQIDADVLAKAFRISTGELRQSMRDGTITSRFERGEAEDAGKVRLTFYSATKRVRLTADEEGNILTRSVADYTRRALNASKTNVPPNQVGGLRQDRLDTLLDIALQGTFPASDPVAICFDPPKQVGNN
ncbi:DUF6522 family protein [Thioclava sp.]|uniref:DUF6522 family protein n=1 Tax=Thioclava sp. TaxID=1933450 RepID=UPI003AA9994A